MVGVKYAGTWADHSGYGNANRAFIMALYVAGVNVTTELVIQVPEKTNYGITEYMASQLKDRQIDYKIKIIHLTPDMYPRYMEANKYNIGHLFWETDKLPAAWVGPCNQMAEIWTASDRMATMLKSSGVKVPIFAFPQPISIIRGYEQIAPFETKYQKTFTFYSIFQWIERKNPRVLLQAYWKAFEGNNDVALLIKTYRTNYSTEEYLKIKRDILEWKGLLHLTHYPKVLLTGKLLQDAEMMKLHALGDCYVNASSGEGWCRPVHEAMLMGKPVISGDNGGITDYLNESQYMRVAGSPVPVREVSWIPWYTAGMNWNDLDEKALSTTMKQVYINRQDAQRKADAAKAWVTEHTSYQAVGNQLKSRLETIERIL